MDTLSDMLLSVCRAPPSGGNLLLSCVFIGDQHLTAVVFVSVSRVFVCLLYKKHFYTTFILFVVVFVFLCNRWKITLKVAARLK